MFIIDFRPSVQELSLSTASIRSWHPTKTSTLVYFESVHQNTTTPFLWNTDRSTKEETALQTHPYGS